MFIDRIVDTRASADLSTLLAHRLFFILFFPARVEASLSRVAHGEVAHSVGPKTSISTVSIARNESRETCANFLSSGTMFVAIRL